jgi:hypothetical protein
MTDNYPTRIVGLECTECGAKTSLKVDEKDAELQNRISYICRDLDGPAGIGCGEVVEHIINHIYGEPAASKLRELNYD